MNTTDDIKCRDCGEGFVDEPGDLCCNCDGHRAATFRAVCFLGPDGNEGKVEEWGADVLPDQNPRSSVRAFMAAQEAWGYWHVTETAKIGGKPVGVAWDFGIWPSSSLPDSPNRSVVCTGRCGMA